MKRFFIISGGKIEDAFAKAVLNGVAEKNGDRSRFRNGISAEKRDHSPDYYR